MKSQPHFARSMCKSVNLSVFAMALIAASASAVDPVINFSSFVGGIDDDGAYSITTDSHGNIYVAGYTNSPNFPTNQVGFDKSANGNADAFVAKFSPNGSNLIYATYLGGSDLDFATDIAVDAHGNAYIVGTTYSDDFPTTAGVFQPNFGGGTDAFVARLDSTGTNLDWATFLGGSKEDADLGASIAIDSNGNAYITGRTWSMDFPLAQPVQPTTDGMDGFCTKINSSGSQVLYSTYLGGNSDDGGVDIAIDADGNAYITGYTYSDDFPTHNAIQPSFAGNPAFAPDAFVTRLNSTGQNIDWSTFLGGDDDEAQDSMSVALDNKGHVFVSGSTRSMNFPTTPGAYQRTIGGGYDSYVTKIEADGSQIHYSTLLGGNQDDGQEITSIAVDEHGNAYIVGPTSSVDFPSVDPVKAYAGGNDAFVSMINPAGSDLVFSTYIGGSANDTAFDLELLAPGRVLVTGLTSSGNFPTVDPFQPSIGNNLAFFDSFISEIGQFAPVAGLNSITKTADKSTAKIGETVTYTITVKNDNQPVSNVEVVEHLPAGVSLQSNSASQGTISSPNDGTNTLRWNTGAMAAGTTATMTVEVIVLQNGKITNRAEIVSGHSKDSSSVDVTVSDTAAGDGSSQISIDADKLHVSVGDIVEFTVTLANEGKDIDSVTVRDFIPIEAEVISIETSQGSLGAFDDIIGALRWETGPMSAGENATLILKMKTNFAGELVHRVDVLDGHNTDEDEIIVKVSGSSTQSEAIKLTHAASNDETTTGAEVSFDVEVLNTGDDTVNIAYVDHELPAGFEITSVESQGATCFDAVIVGDFNQEEISSDKYVPCDIEHLASGATARITVNGVFHQKGSFHATALLLSEDFDQIDAKDAFVNVNNGPDLDLEVTVVQDSEETDSLKAGENFSYEITVTNHDGSNATNLSVTDSLPDGVSIRAVSSTQGSNDFNPNDRDRETTSTVNWDIGELEPGESATLYISVEEATGDKLTNEAELKQFGIEIDTVETTTDVERAAVGEGAARSTSGDLPNVCGAVGVLPLALSVLGLLPMRRRFGSAVN